MGEGWTSRRGAEIVTTWKRDRWSNRDYYFNGGLIQVGDKSQPPKSAGYQLPRRR